MITFQESNYHEVVEELKPFLHEHYKEVAMYQDKIDLNPDYELYGQFQDSGMLTLFTMRDDDNLIGYNIFFLKEHPHYRDHVFATNDIVYIDPKYREELTSPEFFKWCEDQLKSSGVSVITYHMKVMKSFQSLMKLLEMDHAEHVYTKYIGQ